MMFIRVLTGLVLIITAVNFVLLFIGMDMTWYDVFWPVLSWLVGACIVVMALFTFTGKLPWENRK